MWEWNDAVVGAGTSSRGQRGGSWVSYYYGYGDGVLRSDARDYYPPGTVDNDVGFRLATLPEPSTYALLALGAGALMWARRRR